MLGKPLTESEADALTGSGLEVVSNYQFGKGETSDWLGGYQAGLKHARRGLELHRAAGDPTIGRSMSRSTTIRPSCSSPPRSSRICWHGRKCRTFEHRRICEFADHRVGVCRRLGAFYWQHNWGTPKGFVHGSAHLHQVSGGEIDGIGIDVNNVLAADYGQWSLSKL